jgi:1-aminocyclopropane-1-carboxylate deaminase/D-cysteine desulfhydrase-like pyridoxal-dependent ACC family enzyme
MATALAALMALPAVELAPHRTPVDRLTRLERALGPECPRLLIKRDDLLSFALGGNKVRKLQMLAAEAQRAGADTLITCGAVQSNHARVTAATGAVLGWRVVLVLSGDPPARPTGNLARDRIFGADVRFVADRAARAATMEEVAEEMRREGRRPFVIPLGGSTPVGAAGMARAIAELGADGARPDVIVHASSSSGTQAGLTVGCALFGMKTSVLGISVDEPADVLRANVEHLVTRMAADLGARAETWLGSHPVDVDDAQIGDGYGIETPASEDALTLVARTEGIVLDRVYESKAMAGLIARVRDGRFTRDQTVLFWHTGGLSE